jgi:hypothetical protein
MKIFTTVLLVLAIGLIIFNATMLNFENLFEGNSLVAIIGIAASICAVLILLIFMLSKKIEQKLKS